MSPPPLEPAPIETPPPRWTRRKEARPAEVLEAALAVFVERGFAGAKLDDVAARAGVSKGTLYLYYKSKEELYKAVIREVLASPLADAQQFIAAYEGSTVELLRGIFALWWRRIGSTQLAALPKLVISDAGTFPDLVTFFREEIDIPRERLLQGVVQRGIDRGEFRAVHVADVARLLSMPLLSMSLWETAFAAARPPGYDPQRFLQSHLDLLLNGLAPPHFTKLDTPHTLASRKSVNLHRTTKRHTL